jgi:hypothetical protein
MNSRVHPFIFVACALFSLVATDATAGEPTAEAIVSASDRIRNPDAPFRATLVLTRYTGGVPGDSATLVVHAKDDGTTRQFKNVIRYKDPSRDRGKVVLLNGTAMWLYDPAGKASIRISAQQRLFGQASNGDVLSVNLAHDYSATLLGTEDVLGSDRKSHRTYHLVLTAKTDDAVYSKLDYWVDAVDSRPVKGRFYSDSGRVLKIAYYGKYGNALNGERPFEVVIVDGVDPKLVTKIDYSDFRYDKIDDAWFQRDYLPHIPPE